jgi:hypothetical protein
MERALTPIPGTGPGSKGSVAPTGKVGAAGKGAGASAYERKLDLIAAGLGPGWTREKVAAGLVTGSLSPAKGSVYEKRINSIAMGLGGAVKGWTPEKVSAALATGQIKVLGPAQVQLNNVDAAGRVLGSTKFDVPAGTSVPGAPTSPAPEDMESITINGQTFTGTHQQVADYRAAHPGLK